MRIITSLGKDDDRGFLTKRNNTKAQRQPDSNVGLIATPFWPDKILLP